ncbi:hypothetical protein F4782DRAFT_502361 [Xylaria castorea]|nr:hypothetical protein F4782DRAFT_502361 [Xylaria castorea]
MAVLHSLLLGSGWLHLLALLHYVISNIFVQFDWNCQSCHSQSAIKRSQKVLAGMVFQRYIATAKKQFATYISSILLHLEVQSADTAL